MSTYYDYQDVKVNIAHRLFEMEGWKVYGYHASESDPYTDYYDPAYWSGIAEKNGYILVVDRSDCQKEQNETRTRRTAEIPADIREKIAKLEQMTQERGASASEEQTAREKIEALKAKESEGVETYTIHTPGHLANPPRCNWHIEKDGIIFEKGTGLLKFADVPDITKDRERESWQKFNNQTPEEWKADFIRSEMMRWNESEERAREIAESRYKSTCEKYALLEQFNKLLAKFNNTAGGMVGNAGEDGYIFEEITKTEYKEELKPVKSDAGAIRDGQLFRVVKSFNYGIFAGYVYRIHETESTDKNGETVKLYHAYRLGKGYKKERTGYATQSNSWYIGTADSERFLKWFESGALEWVSLETVRTPYEVKKVVKKYTGNHETAKKTAETTTSTTESTTAGGYIITPDTDTRDGSALWVVTLSDRVSREEFDKIREQMKTAGGYYSRYKKGFIFREDPTEKLNGEPAQDAQKGTETTATGKSTTTPEKGEEKPKTNRIPRNATRLYIRYNVGTTAGEAGIRATVEKDETGRYIATMETGERFTVFLDHLRNPEIVTLEKVETESAPDQGTTAEETTQEPATVESAEDPDTVPEFTENGRIGKLHAEIMRNGKKYIIDAGKVGALYEVIVMYNGLRIDTPDEIAQTRTDSPAEARRAFWLYCEMYTPQDAPESVTGYTGESSDLFTPEEVERLQNGEQVTKGEGFRRDLYISTPAGASVRLVYRIHQGEAETITPGTDSKYAGAIVSGLYYSDFSKVLESLAEEVNAEIMRRIPDEETAEKNAGELDERESETMQFLRGRDYIKEARRHVTESTTPTLNLYHNSTERLTASDAIKYLLNPAEVVQEIAKAYTHTRRAEILKDYISHNRTKSAYDAIIRDESDPVHVMNRIGRAIPEDVKTVKIYLANGHTVRAEAHAVRRIPYAGTISSYYIVSGDRNNLNKDERGRDLDILPEEVRKITHGARVLYNVA